MLYERSEASFSQAINGRKRVYYSQRHCDFDKDALKELSHGILSYFGHVQNYFNEAAPAVRTAVKTELSWVVPKYNTVQVPVVRRLDNAIHRINRYPVDKY